MQKHKPSSKSTHSNKRWIGFGWRRRNVPAVEEQKSQLTLQQTNKRKSSLRAGLAVTAGRTAGALSRRLRIGGGTSVVGMVAQRLYPDIVQHLGLQLEHGNL